MRFVWAFAIVAVLGIIVFLGVGGAGAQSDCLQHIDSDGPISGQWNSDCLSENTPTEPTNPPPGTRYARFYSFTIPSSSEVTVDLTASVDTYLYVMEGIGTNGNVLHENDDMQPGSTNSRIVASLQSGDYTIEATTYNLATTGTFTVTVQGLPTADPTAGPVSPTPTQAPAIATATPEPTSTQAPTPATTVTPAPATSIIAGPHHACALDANGAISCQGLDSHGQVSNRPVSSGFKALSAGQNHSCAIDRNGRIHCWGSDEFGQSSPPMHGGFIAIQSGDNYTCALRSNRAMECWGRFSPVAESTPETAATPTPIPSTPEPTATSTPVPTSSPVPDPPTSASCSSFTPNANLSGCDLTGHDLSGYNLTGASLADSILVDASLNDANLLGADFTGADLSGADLSSADARHAKFKDAVLDGANVMGTQFRSGNRSDDGAMFRGATLTNIVFDPALKLTSVGFINADLSYSQFLGVDLQSADLRNTTAIDTDFSGADLRNAKMKSFRLNRATIDSKTNFEGADLTRADLSGMELSGVDFEDVDLEGADLSDGRFKDGRWDEVNLQSANLSEAEFTDMDFEDADFEHADLNNVQFDDCDLGGAKNMSSAENIHTAGWNDTTCPDGTGSDGNQGGTCYPDNLEPD